MSAQAAFASAYAAIVAPSAATTALMVVDGGSGETAKILLDAALQADMLVIDVELLATDAAPWLGTAAPGTADGCALGPGAAPNRLRIRTDAGAVFLASNIDLVLRSNGINKVVFAGGEPWEFIAVVDTTLAMRGCGVVSPATSEEATALATAWRSDRSNQRGSQPAGKAGRTPVEP